eukprot:scaffold98373_cov26-Tisochrysis_lutea.AAC.4
MVEAHTGAIRLVADRRVVLAYVAGAPPVVQQQPRALLREPAPRRSRGGKVVVLRERPVGNKNHGPPHEPAPVRVDHTETGVVGGHTRQRPVAIVHGWWLPLIFGAIRVIEARARLTWVGVGGPHAETRAVGEPCGDCGLDLLVGGCPREERVEGGWRDAPHKGPVRQLVEEGAARGVP